MTARFTTEKLRKADIYLNGVIGRFNGLADTIKDGLAKNEPLPDYVVVDFAEANRRAKTAQNIQNLLTSDKDESIKAVRDGLTKAAMEPVSYATCIRVYVVVLDILTDKY